MATDTTKHEVIAGLDAVRFGAALLVVLYHFVAPHWADPPPLSEQIIAGRAVYPELFPFAWSGFIGVEIFFVISGLVIAYSAAAATPWRFVQSRFLRLYPTAWICASLTTLAMLAFSTGIGFYFDGRLFMIEGFMRSLILNPFGPPWADGSYWTLGIEMSFYLLVFLVLAVGTYRRIEAVAYGIGLISGLYWIIGGIAAPADIMQHQWDRWRELLLLNHGLYFALGIFLYLLRRSGVTMARLSFIVFLLGAAGAEISFNVVWQNHAMHLDKSALLPLGLFLSAVAAMVMSLWWQAPSRVAAFCRAVGLATYPLYLLHDQIGAISIRVLVDHGASRYMAMLVTIGLCVCTSLAVALGIEPPVRLATRRLIEHARGRAALVLARAG